MCTSAREGAPTVVSTTHASCLYPEARGIPGEACSQKKKPLTCWAPNSALFGIGFASLSTLGGFT